MTPCRDYWYGAGHDADEHCTTYILEGISMIALPVQLNNGQEAMLDETVVAEFKAKLRGEIVTPDSPNYDAARLIWNGKIHDKRPAIIARCTGVADVIDAVNFAREH